LKKWWEGRSGRKGVVGGNKVRRVGPALGDGSLGALLPFSGARVAVARVAVAAPGDL